MIPLFANADLNSLINNNNYKYSLDSTKLNLLKDKIDEQIEITNNFYNEYLKENKILNKNNFNLNSDIIKIIDSKNGKIILNNYINIKKLFLLKEQVNSILSEKNKSEYDCTEIYNLLISEPIYKDKPKSIPKRTVIKPAK